MLDFTPEISRLTAREFMTQLLKECYQVKYLVIGYDHRFGHNRSEGFEDYVRYGKEIGIEVIRAKAYTSNIEIGNEPNIPVSSSLIRKLLHEGEVSLAAHCLKYEYFLDGIVVGGYQVGRKIGFPTANLRVEVQKKASEGSLFGMEQPSVSKPQPAPQQTASQPAAAPASQYRSGEQIPMFLPEQPAPVSQPVSQPQPPRSAVHPGQQTPFTGQPQTQSVQYTISVPQAQPVPQQAVPQPQGIQFHQPVQMQQARIDEKQWMQPAPPQPRYAPVQEAARTYEEREYLRQPQEAAMYNFDKDCEDDREMLREDPYAEYPDFPKECRMTDMAQMDMVYC